jgi:hypothetical protein
MKRNVTLFALLIAAASARAVRAEPAGKAGLAEPACPPVDVVAPAAAAPGLRAFLDPQTGELREPTAEEAQAVSRAAREAFARAVNNLQAVVHPDGMISVDLGDLFLQDLVAVKGPDGSISMRCLPRARTFAQRTSTSTPPPAPAPPLEEK